MPQSLPGAPGRSRDRLRPHERSHALYAGGTFGTVQEFYVVPEARNTGIGSSLLDAVRDYGRSQRWTRLELCTPPLPQFERALAFYQRNGFEVTGGRKMRALLP